MNFLILEQEELDGQKVCVKERSRLSFVNSNFAIEKHKAIRAGVRGGKLGELIITEVTTDKISGEANFNLAPPPRLELAAIIGQCRPQSVKKIVEIATEIGVAEVYFVLAEHTVPGYGSTKVLRDSELRALQYKALCQVGDTQTPKISQVASLQEALLLIADAKVRLLGEVKEGVSINSIKYQKEKIALAIGCEAGWSQEEKARLLAAKFQKVSLADRPFRVEIAFSLFSGILLAGIR